LKFPAAPFNLTSLYFTSRHFTTLLDDFRHTSIPFVSPHLQLFPNSFSKKNIGLQGRVSNASVGSFVAGFNGLIYRGMLPDIRSLLFVPNFPNMITLLK
jgi:hypothetical protein